MAGRFAHARSGRVLWRRGLAMADDGSGAGRRARVQEHVGESLYTPQVGAEICARVAAGESLTAICAEPGMPHRASIRNWRKAHPQFAEALWRAMRAARTAVRALDRQIAAARAAQRALGRRGRPSTYTPAAAAAICERIENGESVIAIGADPAMPCAGTIYGWVRRYPDFEEMYVRARDVQADYLLDEAREVSLDSTHKTVWSDRLRFDTIRWMTAQLAPKKYCERLVVDAHVSARKAQEDPRSQPFEVIVKRFCDVTPEDEAEADATEALYERKGW